MQVFIRTRNGERQILCSDCFEKSPFIAATEWAAEDTAYLAGWGECRIASGGCGDLLFDTTADPDALFSPYRNLR